MNKDRLTATSTEPIPDEDIRAFMQKVGIPLEKFGIYKEFVEWETDMRSFAKYYASALDYTSPDRNEEVKKQNSRIREIRRAMGTTEVGRKKLSEMEKMGKDVRSAVPYPVRLD